jgi:predicted nucleic acid-binding protein
VFCPPGITRSALGCQRPNFQQSGALLSCQRQGANHAEDALIAATAASEADVLVTNETRLASKIQRAGGFSIGMAVE